MKKLNIDIERFRKSAIQAIKEIKDATALESLRIRFLGRQGGELTEILRSLKNLALEEKRRIGPVANSLRGEIEKALEQKLESLKVQSSKLKVVVDLTMPGKRIETGHLHPLTLVEKEIREIFKAMNFSVVEGPEVETEYYNFDALNVPKDHPAREMHDTFWLKQFGKTRGGRLLLRTHTSPIQIHYMETHQPPFQIVGPGRAFRYEATDASHETNFHQIEALMVGKDVTLANFKFVIQEFFKRLFKKKVQIRLRPSYFPFVEPGLEVDIQCVKCDGKGCNICKESGWLEVMGAGMVHPKVFEAVRYNPKEWRGFAFGLGPERIAMIKYNIPDIRLFYSGDLRFIKQF
ncbi:MAG: phenylalanine--tRNA ligase subunit alpha [Candidatus Harrisonbacteria bacterium]|nr:phenylalanine--tRNA ligase subunit alpha [Candidatus Harrisonbacteria bacterium]